MNLQNDKNSMVELDKFAMLLDCHVNIATNVKHRCDVWLYRTLIDLYSRRHKPNECRAAGPSCGDCNGYIVNIISSSWNGCQCQLMQRCMCVCVCVCTVAMRLVVCEYVFHKDSIKTRSFQVAFECVIWCATHH